MGIPLEFSMLGYCADWLCGGNYISPTPPFLTLCRAFETRGLRPSYRGGPAGLTCRPLAANSSPPDYVGLWRRAFAALRSAASLLLLAAHFF